MVDLKEHMPFNLFPGELKLEDFLVILDTAMEDVFHQRPKSEALKRIISFLNGLTMMNKKRFESLDEIGRNAFIARGFWMNELRKRYEGSGSEYNPLFPFRIQPWLSGKKTLFEEVARTPRGLNAERVAGFLATWKELAKQHGTRLIKA